MATNNSDQANNENLQPNEGGSNQQADAASGEGPPKTAKQLAKEAEKAEKLRKFNEKQEAKAQAEKLVRMIRIVYFTLEIIRLIFRKRRKLKVQQTKKKLDHLKLLNIPLQPHLARKKVLSRPLSFNTLSNRSFFRHSL